MWEGKLPESIRPGENTITSSEQEQYFATGMRKPSKYHDDAIEDDFPPKHLHLAWDRSGKWLRSTQVAWTAKG